MIAKQKFTAVKDHCLLWLALLMVRNKMTIAQLANLGNYLRGHNDVKFDKVLSEMKQIILSKNQRLQNIRLYFNKQFIVVLKYLVVITIGDKVCFHLFEK